MPQQVRFSSWTDLDAPGSTAVVSYATNELRWARSDHAGTARLQQLWIEGGVRVWRDVPVVPVNPGE